jgi:predicted RNA-binding Zn-ribbon protein involved in translation (DUF1610 family)
MTEKAGEIARGTSLYRCESCKTHIHLKSGELIPKCPNCGRETFDISNVRFQKLDS